MSDDTFEYEQIDAVLKTHLSRELDGQLGRAALRFREELAKPAAPVVTNRRHAAWWAWGIVGAALAASVALVLTLSPENVGRAGRGLTHGGGPKLVASSTNPSPDTDNSSDDVTHTVSWNTIDDGTVYPDDDGPMRKLRRERVDQLQWIDKQTGERVEVTVPREEVMLVGLNKY